MDRFIIFDVETPNHLNNRMSSVGICVLENNQITDEKYYLIDPECDFDLFNIELTGITPQMVEGKLNFSGVWNEIEELFSSGILVAHNAQFDMSVLAKCLKAYDIRWKCQTEYACTCTMGKKLLPDFPNHKLDTMCDILGFELDHHNAMSDARACALIMKNYLDSGASVDDYVRKYDIDKICTIKKRG